MENIKGRLYIHRNKINGKCYVGQTIQNNVRKRWQGGTVYAGTKFGNAIKKYGWDNFEHIILPEIYRSHLELNEAEIMLIEKLGTYSNGYNSTKGGEGKVGYVASSETRAKLGKAFCGKHHTEETKRLLREINIGKKHTEESKNKMKLHAAATRHCLSFEHKKAISNSLKEYYSENNRSVSEAARKRLSEFASKRVMSEDTRKKISLSLKGKTSPNKGRTMSEEQKRKISETLKNRTHSSTGRAPGS